MCVYRVGVVYVWCRVGLELCVCKLCVCVSAGWGLCVCREQSGSRVM